LARRPVVAIPARFSAHASALRFRAEVNAHKAVLDLATKAAAQTQNSELKNLIQKAAPVIQGHLTKAESIQKSLK